jgi:filamentous hemagglutinin family protein
MAQRQRIRPSTSTNHPRPAKILGLAAGLAILGFFATPAPAQIVPDGTLGTQAIPVTLGACAGAGGVCGITTGTTRGSNLFHSFRQFSLPNGDFAAFVTNPTIQNVIVRVTGQGNGFISNINGTIATVNPTLTVINPANFFLINPNGIVFGSGARLLNGGSFLASTAERMLFQDGTAFDTRDQTSNPLLTVSVPIGLDHHRETFEQQEYSYPQESLACFRISPLLVGMSRWIILACLLRGSG